MPDPNKLNNFTDEMSKNRQYNIDDLTHIYANNKFSSSKVEDPLIVAAKIGVKLVGNGNKVYDPILYAIQYKKMLQPYDGKTPRQKIHPIKYAIENNLKINGKNAFDFFIGTKEGIELLKDYTSDFLQNDRSQTQEEKEKNFLHSIGINSEQKDPNIIKRILNAVSFGKLFRESIAKKEAVEFLKSYNDKNFISLDNNSYLSTTPTKTSNNSRSR